MASTETVAIELPKLNIEMMQLVLVGDTPLICHAWSQKAKLEMLNKQMKKATAGKEAKDPERDFLDSLYSMSSGAAASAYGAAQAGKKKAPEPIKGVHVVADRAVGGEWGFPVIAFKAAAVTACTSIGGITKVMARQAFHVIGDMKTDYSGKTAFSGELARIQGADPRMREDMVRVGMGTADIRYRGEFWPWFVKLTVRFNANVLSAGQIANLFNTAGFGVGIGEWRAERDGSSGLFHVGEETEVGALLKAA